MRRVPWRPAAAAAAAAALVAGLLTGIGTPIAAAAPAAAPPDAAGVTLVTGDKVTVSADGQAAVEPGPGRAGMTFQVTTASGRVRVIPADAGALLAAGRLDVRLFDVTGLIEGGYARRDGLPLIVTGDGSGTRAGVTTAARRGVTGIAGLTGVRDLSAIDGVAVRQVRTTAADAWRGLTGSPGGARLRAGLGKIWLDGVRRPALDTSVAQIGAPTAWAGGFTGTGASVAVLDTGIDTAHPDLAGQVAARRDFTGSGESELDLSGHGTHVAATIAGTGMASGGTYRGVAPGAKLLDAKVCDRYGCYDSAIIAGMIWAAEQGAKVANLSFSAPDSPGLDPVEQAVQDLSTSHGMLFVVAAGNADGPTYGAVGSPGTAPAALTVGAVDSTDAVAPFSRRGPGPDGALKPEITAPGVAITAARSTTALDVPGAPTDAYTQLSGTSMATPHVAGVAALLYQRHPGWTGQQLKAALMAAAQPRADQGVYTQGAGRVDAARAVAQTVTSTTAGISFGALRWPHTDNGLTHQQAVFRNTAATPVTLDLRLNVTGPDGAAVPAGMFTVTPAQLTVPAGGEATATVTADTRLGPDGLVGGWLTATAGEIVVGVPVTVDKEVESYDVTLVHTDRAGRTPSFFLTQLARRDSDRPPLDLWGPDPDGTVILRVPKAHYSLNGFLHVYPEAPPVTKGASATTAEDRYDVMLAQPDLLIDRAMTIRLDGTRGLPLSVTVPRTSARQYYAVLAAYTRRPHGTAGGALVGGDFSRIYAAQLTPAPLDPDFVSIVSGQWARADTSGSLWASPYVYALSFPQRGRMVTGYQRAVTDDQLASVRADFAHTTAGTSGAKRIRGALTDYSVGNFGPYLGFPLPFTRKEYYTADPLVTFAGDFAEIDATTNEQISGVSGERRAYRADRSYLERWNRPVFAPSLSDGVLGGVTRTGDTLTMDIGLYGDGAGRPGRSQTDSVSGTLHRDGVKLADLDGAEYAEIALPAQDGRYRLELRAERGARFALFTRTQIAWTFRSGHVSGTALPLPLSAIRWTPALDRFGTAPAGRLSAVPVTVLPQAGSTAGAVTSLSVQASFDDGTTWQNVSVKDGCAWVRHPSGSGFVSLRAQAATADGSTVEVTVIRAYRYA
ncbi:S8 family serine peptidase [Catellatospora chokoriensis]|uniref:Serine protease n=1 Tax=Catellatospora chokoriensis TaxID=310353 RepID=A0A8J3K5R0_9ACTN|nr:S8 family serine peptidase [Catellatospora chokoriensis]GIF93616.1 serine protease [Catellatospora chokoriensis]